MLIGIELIFVFFSLLVRQLQWNTNFSFNHNFRLSYEFMIKFYYRYAAKLSKIVSGNSNAYYDNVNQIENLIISDNKF